MIDGNSLERACKNHLSGFRDRDRLEHASEWMLLEQNTGARPGIDGTSFCDDLFTILSNRDGHGRQGTLVATVRGVKPSGVVGRLMQIPAAARLAVEEATMDFSDSMYSIVRQCFPNAMTVIDCLHTVKRCGDALEELRLQARRLAIKEQKKERLSL